MGWRDFQNPILVEKKEKRGETPVDAEKIPFIPFIPPEVDSENPDLTILEHLDETSRGAFREYVDLMNDPKFKMPIEQARQEAMRLVLRNLRTLQIQQAAKDYRKQGWVKIYSTVLGRAVYLVRVQQAVKRLPDQDIPIFLESDIEEVKGLTSDEAKVLLEARILFDGPVKVEDYSDPPSQRNMDGKKIARKFEDNYQDLRKFTTIAEKAKNNRVLRPVRARARPPGRYDVRGDQRNSG
ncbi:MAG: hypothetical protein IH886_09490 [Nitrospinae bacterium]|nr:hypothetical protein [Nitrospinota bacterium]